MNTSASRTSNVQRASEEWDNDDLFSEKNIVKIPIHKWHNVGDRIVGVYVDHFKELFDTGNGVTLQTNYILVLQDGSRVRVIGKGRRKEDKPDKVASVIFDMDKVPFGALVGILFEKEGPGKFNHKSKIITPRWDGRMKKDVLEEYRAKYQLMNQNEAIKTSMTDSETSQESASEEGAPFADDSSEEEDEDLPGFSEDGE